MTDTDTETTTPPSRSRPRPSRPPRQRPPSRNAEITVLERILQRLDALESGDGKLRTTSSEPEPRAETRVAEPLYSSPFLDKLREGTRPVPEDFGGDVEPPYNVPQRLYAKPDGTIVSLQGDAKSRAYYQEKGYHLLSIEEAAHFEKVEKPKLLQAQRRKAHLIGTIRAMFRREPSLVGWREDDSYDASLDLMSISQLEDEWEDLRARSMNPGQKLPPMPRFRSDERLDRALIGVETRPSATAEQFRPRAGRDIEVTAQNQSHFA